MSITLLIRAAAAAESLQSCPTLCNPIDGSPPGSTVPGILQARTHRRTIQKDLNVLDNHDGVVTHLEPDIQIVKSSGP